MTTWKSRCDCGLVRLKTVIVSRDAVERVDDVARRVGAADVLEADEVGSPASTRTTVLTPMFADQLPLDADEQLIGVLVRQVGIDAEIHPVVDETERDVVPSSRGIEPEGRRWRGTGRHAVEHAGRELAVEAAVVRLEDRLPRTNRGGR